MTWAPVLAGRDVDRAIEAACAIGEALRPEYGIPATGPGLAGGDAGIALLFAVLHRLRPTDGWDVACRDRLARALAAPGLGRTGLGLFEGVTGVVWAIRHLEANGGGDLFAGDAPGGTDGVDTLLVRVHAGPRRAAFDLAVGTAGHVVYGMEGRVPARDVAAAAAAALVASSWWDGERCAWQGTMVTGFAPGLVDLGVAHGTAGVVAVLAEALRAGILPDGARRETMRVVEGAVADLLARRLPGEGGGFPAAVRDGEVGVPTRAAWCYGDPGIGLVLARAGRALDRPEWVEAGARALLATARRDPASCGVVDAGVCHGAAGLGHLLQRGWRLTGDDSLADAGAAWLGRALDLRREGEGIAGLQAWDPAAETWRDDPGFLSGAAGVAMALIAGATGDPPVWGRCLGLYD